MGDVKLHGFWPSPFVHRVIWGLKLKGIQYDYFEEDFPKKSDLLLKYNPVHKKVPVLVHGGKPIAESLVILEYLDETWPESYRLLPKDAYERATARFWIKYGEEKGPICYTFFRAVGEEQEKAAEEAFQVLKTLEEKGLQDRPFFGGERIGLVDLSLGWLAYWFEGMEQVVNIKIVKPSALPHLHSWINRFKQVPVIRDNAPDQHKLLEHLKRMREKFVAPIEPHTHRDDE